MLIQLRILCLHRVEDSTADKSHDGMLGGWMSVEIWRILAPKAILVTG